MYKITFWAMTYGVGLAGIFAVWSWYAIHHYEHRNLLNKMAPVQILLGIFCFVGGALALFYPLGTEQFVGDLIPGMAALLIGFWLAFSNVKPQVPVLYQISQKMTPLQLPLGILAIASALVHYFLWGTKNFF
ncbi:MAG: hypothetical protein HY390_03045 [Deltaproteobacteria bacterium]|nr:hypothetical protein [Deltaproteobacteria bacterium]